MNLWRKDASDKGNAQEPANDTNAGNSSMLLNANANAKAESNGDVALVKVLEKIQKSFLKLSSNNCL